jgi:hypothetical protein
MGTRKLRDGIIGVCIAFAAAAVAYAQPGQPNPATCYVTIPLTACQKSGAPAQGGYPECGYLWYSNGACNSTSTSDSGLSHRTPVTTQACGWCSSIPNITAGVCVCDGASPWLWGSATANCRSAAGDECEIEEVPE